MLHNAPWILLLSFFFVETQSLCHWFWKTAWSKTLKGVKKKCELTCREIKTFVCTVKSVISFLIMHSRFLDLDNLHYYVSYIIFSTGEKDCWVFTGFNTPIVVVCCYYVVYNFNSMVARWFIQYINFTLVAASSLLKIYLIDKNGQFNKSNTPVYQLHVISTKTTTSSGSSFVHIFSIFHTHLSPRFENTFSGLYCFANLCFQRISAFQTLPSSNNH